MLSTDMRQESILKRIEHIVSVIMEEEPLFKESLNDVEIVQDLVDTFEKNLSFEEFNSISEESLKKRCIRIMAVELLATIGDDFTPEQMASFEEAIKRK